MADPLIAIVGAGPAGLRAAEALVAAGLRPVLIEEGQRDGGQIYRRQPEGFQRGYRDLYGSEAERAARIHELSEELRTKIDYRPETLAWALADQCLQLSHRGRSDNLPFDALILATGATDRIMPLRGWNQAGVFSLGGAQIALKAQACAIGRAPIFLGTGPLLYLVAAQYLKAGADVQVVLDTAPPSRRLAALPQLLSRPGLLWRGLALTAQLRRAGVTLLRGVTPLEILGGEGGLSGLSFRTHGGESKTLACDAVALGYHLRPETQLADLAGCAFHFEPETRQWLPEADAEGRSSAQGVYLAGDNTRILGAEAAELSGRLAALAALEDLGLASDETERRRLVTDLARMERFRKGLVQAFPWPHHFAKSLPDDTVICRCEVVTAGDLRQSLDLTGAKEVNRAKAFSRVGMGRCQGRYCGHAAAEVIAAAQGVPLETVGRLRGQAPVKPLPVATERVVA